LKGGKFQIIFSSGKKEPMKAETQIRVGIITAGCLLLILVYRLGSIWSSYGLWLIPLLAIIFAVYISYIFALIKKKLRLAQSAFCIWCFFVLMPLVLGLLGIMFTHYSWRYLVLVFFNGLVVALLWMGIHGLNRLLEAESKSKKDSRAEQNNK